MYLGWNKGLALADVINPGPTALDEMRYLCPKGTTPA